MCRALCGCPCLPGSVDPMIGSNTDYAEFLQKKRVLAPSCGFAVPRARLNAMLFPFQQDVASFDLEHGKAANFMATGTGKGPVQMEWCGHVSEHASGDSLIVAPLAVAQQFKR